MDTLNSEWVSREWRFWVNGLIIALHELFCRVWLKLNEKQVLLSFKAGLVISILVNNELVQERNLY